MASFRTHFSFGILLGIAAVALIVSFALADQPSFFVAVFVAAVIGGVMPDMDSDSGVPFHVTFGVLSCIAGSLALLHVMQTTSHTYQMLIGYPLGAMFAVWVVCGTLFKKLTQHRGMVHSIPAAILAGLVTFMIAQKYGFAEADAFLLAVALTIGFIGHLVLDEIWAAVNFHGVPFIPNKAFGSALKFFSQSKVTNVVVYGLILFLLAGNWVDLSHLSETLFMTVHP
jgi:hypothetical protein